MEKFHFATTVTTYGFVPLHGEFAVEAAYEGDVVADA